MTSSPTSWFVLNGGAVVAEGIAQVSRAWDLIKSPPRSISTENHDDVDREDLYAWD